MPQNTISCKLIGGPFGGKRVDAPTTATSITIGRETYNAHTTVHPLQKKRRMTVFFHADTLTRLSPEVVEEVANWLIATHPATVREKQKIAADKAARQKFLKARKKEITQRYE